jgi:hypothetical protein
MIIRLLAVLMAFAIADNNNNRPSDFIKGSLHSWSLFRRDDIPWHAATFDSSQCAASPVDSSKPIVYLALFVTGGGSTILCTLLNDQGVPCIDEPNLRLAWFTDVDGSTVALNEARNAFRLHPLRPLSTALDSVSRVVGAKVKLERPSQMPRELITALLDSDAKRSLPFDLRFIFLHRRDLVRHTIGLIRKRHLPPVVVASAADNSTVKIVHAEGYGNAYRGRVTPAIHIALPEYVNYLFHVINAAKALLDFESAMRANRFATLRLVYEDNLVLPSQWNATTDCVVRFLTGGRARPVLTDSSWPVKNTQLNMSADVTNFDEVREFTLELQSVIALGAQLDWPKQKPRNRSPFSPELFNNNED